MCLTKLKYRVRSGYLRAGDVLLNEDHCVEISSFASMCMSSSQAMKIDTSLDKAGIKGAFSLSEQYETEVKKKMVFEVIF